MRAIQVLLTFVALMVGIIDLLLLVSGSFFWTNQRKNANAGMVRLLYPVSTFAHYAYREIEPSDTE